ncbi:MAG TPA: hypothetical protein VIV11_15845 [Kofleriaceae bacterium]
MGALKTSEQGEAVAGEGQARSDPDRPVEASAKIIISADPIATPSSVAPVAPGPRRSAPMPVAEPRRGGLGLVIALYILSATALAYAIYERFLVG